MTKSIRAIVAELEQSSPSTYKIAPAQLIDMLRETFSLGVWTGLRIAGHEPDPGDEDDVNALAETFTDALSAETPDNVTVLQLRKAA